MWRAARAASAAALCLVLAASLHGCEVSGIRVKIATPTEACGQQQVKGDVPESPEVAKFARRFRSARGTDELAVVSRDVSSRWRGDVPQSVQAEFGESIARLSFAPKELGQLAEVIFNLWPSRRPPRDIRLALDARLSERIAFAGSEDLKAIAVFVGKVWNGNLPPRVRETFEDWLVIRFERARRPGEIDAIGDVVRKMCPREVPKKVEWSFAEEMRRRIVMGKDLDSAQAVIDKLWRARLLTDNAHELLVETCMEKRIWAATEVEELDMIAGALREHFPGVVPTKILSAFAGRMARLCVLPEELNAIGDALGKVWPLHSLPQQVKEAVDAMFSRCVEGARSHEFVAVAGFAGKFWQGNLSSQVQRRLQVMLFDHLLRAKDDAEREALEDIVGQMWPGGVPGEVQGWFAQELRESIKDADAPIRTVPLRAAVGVMVRAGLLPPADSRELQAILPGAAARGSGSTRVQRPLELFRTPTGEGVAEPSTTSSVSTLLPARRLSARARERIDDGITSAAARRLP